MMAKAVSLVLLFFVFGCLSACVVNAQTTEFTYQGSLKDSAIPASGNYDFEFALFDALSGGNQIGVTLPRNTVTVTNGIFAVKLDFGSQFPGANRFLEIRVRVSGQPALTTLAPRQLLNSAPYSVKSLSADNAANAVTATNAQTATNATNATTANNALNLGGVAAGQYVLNGDIRLSDARNPLPGSANYVQPNDSRLTDARNPLPGSANYVQPNDPHLTDARNPLPGSPNYLQNTTSQQAGNFNISGNGTAGSINVNGAVTVAGISPPAAAPAGQGRIYFDTSTNKVKVSENGGAFVNLVGAGGVSGSGTASPSTIAMWTGGGTALTNSFITQSANGVQLPNGVQLGLGAQMNQVQFGSPNGETGMTISGTDSINGGRADLRFGGGMLKLVVGQAGVGPPSALNGIAITTNGDVGIGTSPGTNAKLQVNGGFRDGVVGIATSIFGTGVSGSNGSDGVGVEGVSNTGIGVKALSNNTGVDSDGSVRGVYGHTQSSGPGVEGYSANGPGLIARGTAVNSNLVEGYNSSFAGRRFHITSGGTYVAGSDFAEALPARGGKTRYEAGDVLVLSTKVLGTVEKTNRPYDTRVMGIYSTRPGILGADKDGATRVDPNDLPVAIVGIVPTKVSTENGPVRAGDLLTTSRTLGYAMKASPVVFRGVKIYRAGTLLGKALEPLQHGKGVIKVLVTLR